MILIIGGRGQLGQALQDALPAGSFILAPPVMEYPHASYSMCSQSNVDYVINCAAWTDVRAAEHPDNWHKVNFLNVEFPAMLARDCEEYQKKLIHISSDYVFDGTKGSPYKPDDPANPINYYGASKAAGELLVRQTGATIIRTAGLFSGYGPNFVRTIFDRIRLRGFAEVTDALTVSVTSADNLAQLLIHILDVGDTHWTPAAHYVDSAPVSWFEVAREVAACMTAGMFIIRRQNRPDGVRRPVYSALASTWAPMSSWRQEVTRVVEVFKRQIGEL